MNSTMISAVSTKGKDLIVTFAKGGKRYSYAGAAPHAKALTEAESAGRYFRANILGKFAHTAL